MCQEFIDKLLAGSRKLHQLELDVNQVVRTLLGLIKKDYKWKERLHINGGSFFFDDCFWEIKERGGNLQVRLIQTSNLPPGIIGYIRYSTDQTWVSGYQYSTQIPYAAKWLPEFVEQLLVEFPYLKSSAAPILAAAE